MIPTVLASQLQQGIRDFLETTFPITNPFFHGMLDRFLAKKDNIFKGPFLSLMLPFHVSKGKNNFFPHLPMPHDPYRHQEKAFIRLSGDSPQSTIVATGTGSGKTECFLYPILDHIRRHSDQPGIKAILIYPMNALATDQSQRLARLIHQLPSLQGNVTAGLYVGQESAHPAPTMSQDQIITDKRIIREKPPDILITNYKMLDYLLIRPTDRVLWEKNNPHTLKYLVVDELHTFDGAQGTDLACLIRRLKSRLKTPANHLCCVGTSATIGGKSKYDHLLDYARNVFAEPFGNDAVVDEDRVSVRRFLKGNPVDYLHRITPDKHPRLRPLKYTNADAYIRGQYEVWFGEEAATELDTAATKGDWKEYLGTRLPGRLKSHATFRLLLESMDGHIMETADVVQELKRGIGSFPRAGEGFHEDLLNSLIALVSFARAHNPKSAPPFIDIRIQVWMRELRRMAAEVKSNPRLRFHDDLKENKGLKHLPVIHCRGCGNMGWGGVYNQGKSKITEDLHDFYLHYFKRMTNLSFIFPVEADAANDHRAESGFFCTHCLYLSLHSVQNKEACPSCAKPMIPVVVGGRTELKKNDQDRNHASSDHHCPFCKMQNSLSILGSRAVSLISVFTGQLGGSHFNNDRKLVTFSDSVQDAAHRAGFLGARTYSFNFRAALTQALAAKGEGKQLDQLPGLFSRHWRAQLGDTEYIRNFIAPNMEWLEDFDHLRTKNKLPNGSDLMNLVEKRVDWNICSEFGLTAHRGRTLERSGVAVLQNRADLTDAFARDALPKIHNEVRILQDLDEERLKTFITGFFFNLKQSGGIFHPLLREYIMDGGSTFQLGRKPFMPNIGPNSPAPLFLSFSDRNTNVRRVVTDGTKPRTWHQYWLLKHFPEAALVLSGADQFYRILLGGLTEAGILEQRTGKSRETLWGLVPSALTLTNQVDRFACDTCKRRVSVGRGESKYWQGMPCTLINCHGHFKLQKEGMEDDYYGKLYQNAEIHRVAAREHTGILSRPDRENLEKSFREGGPWAPNVLCATPTIEMGIDIGDLSNVILCSVPPATSNYLQRIGRSGRKNGNSLNITLANGVPHDLYFFTDPEEMISGHIVPPGVFLGASAILERQFIAFCLDCWVGSGISASEFPRGTGTMLNQFEAGKTAKFPFTFFSYISDHREQLLATFIRMFDDVIGERTTERLTRFVSGNRQDPENRPEWSSEESDGLVERIEKCLTRKAKTRGSYSDNARRLQKERIRIENDPARSLDYEQEMERIDMERSALKDLVKRINEQDVLNFFTDEGLIPNYTFPETGVILQSVVYRRRKERPVEPDSGKAPKEKKGRGYDHWTYEYKRPAANAIRELAPANHFYAGGRKVKIERVDLKLASVENWRFCPQCNFSRQEALNNNSRHCPRCNSGLWSDLGQVQQILRMRQVFASTNDRDSRIADDRDDREPNFYEQQMLVDIDPANIREGFEISEPDFPFGFEFMEKAGFMEVNFGEKGEQGRKVSIAGIEAQRKGFTVCKRCGQVQEAMRTNRKDTAIYHALDCTVPRQSDPQFLHQCLYLYRQFESEAIRLRLPRLLLQEGGETDDAENKNVSLVAAIHLGLKCKFGGAVDHITTTMYNEPVEGSSHSCQYLVLYDRVPGGTGYLKELMRSELPLLDVLEKALDALKKCACDKDTDSDRDGCYRCLLAYRHSRNIRKLSRKAAMELLEEILKRKESLRHVNTLGRVDPESILESRLEKLFLEKVQDYVNRRRGRDGGDDEANYKFKEEKIEKRTSFYVTVKGNRYQLEAQVELGPSKDVQVQSRADFVFYPMKPAAGNDSRPVVVFTDGYQYHKDKLTKDSRQRMAIARSERFIVWSLTWNDVNVPTGKNTYDHFNHYLFSGDPPGDGDRGRSQPTRERFIGIQQRLNLDESFQRRHEKSSFELLMDYLGSPQRRQWELYAFAHLQHWANPGIPPDLNGKELENVLAGDMLDTYRDLQGTQFASGFGFRTGDDAAALHCRAAVLLEAVSARDTHGCLAVLCLEDGEIDDSDEKIKAFKIAWNSWLRYYNIMQFLRRGYMVNRRGLEANEYDDMIMEPRARIEFTAPDPVWEELPDLVDGNLHQLLACLAKAGVTPPEPGLEVSGGEADIELEAELGWEDLRVAVLLEEQEEYREKFEAAGWRVFGGAELGVNPAPLVNCLAERTEKPETGLN